MGVTRTTSAEAKPPRDVGNLAVLTYFGLGVAYLLPWNAYLTAVDYFEYLYPNSHIDRVFTVAYLLPCLIVLTFLVTAGEKTSSRFRTNVGLVLLLISILMVPTLDTFLISGEEKANNSLAHFLTVGSVSFAGMGDSLVQASVIGGAGELPDRYMQAIISGTGSCGVLVSLLRIVTKAALPQDAQGLRTSANFYFIVSGAFLVLCTISFNQVHKLAVMIHYKSMRKSMITGNVEAEAFAVAQDLETDRSTLLVKATESGDENYAANRALSYPSLSNGNSLVEALSSLKWLVFSFILVYITTLSIFPGFLAEDVHSAYLKDWYPVLLIGTYNVFDLVGKAGTSIYIPKSQSATVVGSITRLLFFPLFAACLHGPKAFRTEAPVFILTALLGATNGYFTSTGFIVAPKLVPFAEAERAGIIMVIALAVGLTLGSLVGWVWVI